MTADQIAEPGAPARPAPLLLSVLAALILAWAAFSKVLRTDDFARYLHMLEPFNSLSWLVKRAVVGPVIGFEFSTVVLLLLPATRRHAAAFAVVYVAAATVLVGPQQGSAPQCECFALPFEYGLPAWMFFVRNAMILALLIASARWDRRVQARVRE